MADTTDTTGPLGYPSDAAERARILHAEGRFGGPQPGSGRPRVPRASQLAAEAAAEHWAKIEAALLHGVENGPPEQRARAAARWVTLTQREDAHELRERADARVEDVFDRMTVDEVHARAADLLLESVRSGAVDVAQLLALAPAEPVADAVVIDDA
jgi:hypothetical protein